MAVLTDLFYVGCCWPYLFRVCRSIYVIISCVARKSAAHWGAEAARKLSIVISAQAIVPAIGFAFGGVIAEFIGWRGSIGIMAMGGLLIAVMSYLFIDESRRGDTVLFRPASLVAAYPALLKTSGVMFHGLTSDLATGLSLRMR